MRWSPPVLSSRLRALTAVVAVALAMSVAPAAASEPGSDYDGTGARGPGARTAATVARPIVFPVEGTVSYTDTFGACRGSGCSRSHEGIDLMGHQLQRVIASADATVTWLRDTATPDGRRGNLIILTGDDGWEYWYIHLNNDSPGTDDGANPPEWIFAPGIRIGSRVRAGQHIGFVGDSGNAESCNCPHVHYEIRDPDGVPINPYASLREARHLVLDPADQPDPIVADIDDDPAAEVLLYAPGTTADHRYDGDPDRGLGWFATEPFRVNGTYVPLVGDYDGNGYDDIFWYAAGGAPDYLWAHGPEGRTNTRLQVTGTYRPFVGDFDGNGHDDIFWYAPGRRQDYLWAHGPAGTEDRRLQIYGTYEPLVGDYDGNGHDDILWYAAGTRQDYLWAHHTGGHDDIKRTINGTYRPLVGDYDGNTMSDVYWYRPGTPSDFLWRHVAGGYLSSRDDQDAVERAGSGDLDGDGTEEIVWFRTFEDRPRAVWSLGEAGFAEIAAAVS